MVGGAHSTQVFVVLIVDPDDLAHPTVLPHVLLYELFAGGASMCANHCHEVLEGVRLRRKRGGRRVLEDELTDAFPRVLSCEYSFLQFVAGGEENHSLLLADVILGSPGGSHILNALLAVRGKVSLTRVKLGAIGTNEVAQSAKVLVDVTHGLKDAILAHVLGGEFIVTAYKCRQRHRVVHEVDRALMPIAHVLDEAAEEVSLGQSHSTIAIALYTVIKMKELAWRFTRGKVRICCYLLVTSSIISVVIYSLSMLRIKSGRLW